MNIAPVVLVPLLQASLVASLAILLLAPLRRLLQRWVPASASYVLWTFVFVRLCFPSLGPVSVVPKPWRNDILLAAVTASAASEAVVDMAQGKPAFPGLESMGRASGSLKATAFLLSHGASILAIGWLAGFLIAEGVGFSRRKRFHRAVLAQSSPADLRVIEILQAEMDLAPEKRKPILAVSSSAVGAPACYRASWKETWIVIPPGLCDQLSPEELRMVILHELTHWKRKDLKTQGFLRFAARVHWFNPIVHWGLSLSRADCETACDASVLEKLTNEEASLYGMTLLKVARLMKAEALPAPAVGIVEGRGRLPQRIRQIASYRRPGFWATFGGLAVSATFGLLLFVLSPSVHPAAAHATSADTLLNQPSQERFREAQSLARRGSYAQALAGYEWCFDTGMKADRGMVGVRRSFLLSAWANLGADFPPAKAALTQRREAAQNNLATKAGDFDSWEDFVSINEYLGEDAKTLEYYDSAKKAGARLPDSEIMFDEFLKARRYQDAAQAQPYSRYASNFDTYQGIQRMASKLRVTALPLVDGQSVDLHYLVLISGEELEALAGAGDLEGAKAVVAKMLQANNSPQTLKILREHAIRAGHPEIIPQSGAEASADLRKRKNGNHGPQSRIRRV